MLCSMTTRTLLDYWWVPVLRGVLGIVAGVLMLAWPKITIVVLLALIAAWWIIDGLFSLWYAIKAKNWGWAFWGGLVSLVAGILVFLKPGIAALSVVLVIAIWAIVRGVIDIYTAIRFRKEMDYEWWLALGGLASIIFGGLVLRNPGVGVLAIVAMMGIFSIIIGVLFIFAGFHIRSFRNKSRPMGV